MSDDDKKQKFPYDSVMFLLVRPNRTIASTHRVRNKKEHTELLDKARSKKLQLYYADVMQIDGRWYTSPHWIIDWDSVDEPVEAVYEAKPREMKRTKVVAVESEELELEEPKEPEEVVQVEPARDEISCPFCDKKMTSTPGRTLHVKSAHPDRYQEYLLKK